VGTYALSSSDANSRFGSSVANGGDPDANGTAAALSGAPGWNAGAGKVMVAAN
jgi:hypothetical protein